MRVSRVLNIKFFRSGVFIIWRKAQAANGESVSVLRKSPLEEHSHDLLASNPARPPAKQLPSSRTPIRRTQKNKTQSIFLWISVGFG